LLLTFVFKHFETAVKNENKVRLEIMIIFRALEIELEVRFRKTIPFLVVEIPMRLHGMKATIVMNISTEANIANETRGIMCYRRYSPRSQRTSHSPKRRWSDLLEISTCDGAVQTRTWYPCKICRHTCRSCPNQQQGSRSRQTITGYSTLSSVNYQ